MAWRNRSYDYNPYGYRPVETIPESVVVDPHLRYRAQYATNGYGTSCNSCHYPFEDGSLQLCVKIQSRTHDRKEYVPYHVKCFFNKQRIRSEADISGFESLRIADQTLIRKQITRNNVKVVKPPVEKGAKKRRKNDNTGAVVKMSAKALRDFGVEYSKSNRALCCGCRQKIMKNLVRVKKVIYDTEVGMSFGGQPLWHHLDCFAKLQTDLGWYGDGEQLPGFTYLLTADQETVRQTICQVPLENVPEVKKTKTITAAEKREATSLAKLIKQQNVAFFDNRDFVAQKLPKSNWLQLLEVNQQESPTADSEILDTVADLLTYGALEKCPTCETGQLKLCKSGFGCTGNISEWAKCDYFSATPDRRQCTIPSWLESKFSNRHMEVQDRLFQVVEPVTVAMPSVKIGDVWQPKVQREKPPLYMMEIVILGRISRSRPELKKVVEAMGGKIVTKMHANTAVVVTTQSIYDKMGEKIVEAKELGIQVVLEEFFSEIEAGAKPVDYISKNSISDWGSDPTTRINQNDVAVMKSSGMFTRAVPKKVKLRVINGTAVDDKSGMADICHVFIDNNVKYTATLNLVDIQSGKNSYYKLQVLEHDNKHNGSYYLFKSWGRIGTTIGSHDTQYFSNSNAAVKEFRSLYKTKTGNPFGKDDYQKKTGLFYPIEVKFDEDSDETVTQSPVAEIPSKLAVPVQELMQLIFDVDRMKKVMLEFDLDMEKLPLGKISGAQVMRAMTVLSEMLNLIKSNGRRALFIGASNHFYSLIPHDFGTNIPPVIDTLDAVNQKNDMLQTMLEIGVAHSLINKSEVPASVCQLDMQYDILNTELEAIETDSNEYNWLAQYVRNTHASTHNNYRLDIMEVFRVNRSGEQKRYEPFATLPNRKLLWHGSRLTNYVGILSHGLRVAPPEAPPSGYMFGKGIYFADMISKSANYCFTNNRNNTGLVLLCEVALGTSKECTAKEAFTSLPPGFHSVKGIGQTYPDPMQSAFTPECVEIPFGTPTVDLSVDSSLLYNEYIVYDVAQVKVKYLFKLKFNYGY